MKQPILFVLIILITASCVSKSKHQEELAATRDSINAVVANRDAEITKFLSDFNTIQLTMDSIKQIENMVSVNSKNKEITHKSKDLIVKDLIQLQQMLDKNKALVSELKGMRMSDSRKLKALQNTIALLEKQLIEKDADIAKLNEKIEMLNLDVSSLKLTIDDLTAESESKSQELSKKEDLMNQASYIIGTSDELLAKNLLVKAGGFLGLGRTLRVSKTLNKEDFNSIDIRSFSTVSVNAKEAQLLSVHPEGSYHFVGSEKMVDSFEIDDPAAFWSISKYMIIATKE